MHINAVLGHRTTYQYHSLQFSLGQVVALSTQKCFVNPKTATPRKEHDSEATT